MSDQRPVLVLHEHDRPRHHVDLRLEENGVLRSWDTGWWELEDRDERRVVFVLHGPAGSRRFAPISTGAGALLHLLQHQPGPSVPPA